MQSFRPPRPLPPQERRSPRSPRWACHPKKDISSCLRLNRAPVLPECVSDGPWPTRACICPPQGGLWVFLMHHKAVTPHRPQGRGPLGLGVSVPAPAPVLRCLLSERGEHWSLQGCVAGLLCVVLGDSDAWCRGQTC